MKIAEFYRACEDILGTKTEYKEQKLYIKFDRETGKPYKILTRATRWGGREPGNGRFPGNGLIRVFGTQIHVTLHNPNVNGTFNSFDEVLKELEEAMGSKKILEISDEIDVYIMGESMGKGTIVEDYDENQWVVEIEITHSDGHKEKVKRYIDKET